MLAEIVRYLKGYLRVRITGYSPERFLNLCSNKGIYLWGLTPKDNCYEMYIGIQGFRKLKPILKKTGTRISITGRFGLPFFLHRNRKRKLFFAGSAACVLLIYILSLFVWDIHLEGNETITDKTLLEYLETTGVSHGMAKRKLDCERIVKDIRKQFDDIIWVSASIQGTRLLIHVKENTDTVKEAEAKENASDIVAAKSGTIVSMITRKGTPQVRQGDTVKKGELLVSGSVEVKNDAEEVINYHYQNSDADILAETKISYKEEIAFTYNEKEYTGAKKRSVFLRIGDFCLTLGRQKNTYKKSEVSTAEKQVKLNEHFYLPIVYGARVIQEYKMKEKTYTKEEVQRLLSDHFQNYCEKLQEKEKQIVENDVKIYMGEKSAVAKGVLKVYEDIGKHRALDIDFQPSPVIE